MTDILAPAPAREIRPRERPTFSVVVAAYQASGTIADALQSLRAQTVPAHEVIVCDDGSTDDLDSALAPYRDEIVLLRQENMGEAAAKNAGARAASGEFVLFLDADDVFLPARIEALGDLACARPDLALLTTDAYLELHDTRVRRAYEGGFAFEVDDQRSTILDHNFLFGLAAVERERFLAAGGFETSLRYATDWDLWCRLILDGVRAGLVARPLACYRLRPDSLSADRVALIRGRCAVLERALARPDLTPAERRVAGAALGRERGLARLVELRDALSKGRPQARRLALAAALARETRVPTRLRALLAAAAPGLARRLLERHALRDGVPAQAGQRVHPGRRVS